MKFMGITDMEAETKATNYIDRNPGEYIRSWWVDPVSLLHIVKLEVKK